MNKRLLIAGISVLAAVSVAGLHREVSAEKAAAEMLHECSVSATAETAQLTSKMQPLQEAIERKANSATISIGTNLDRELANWLLKGDYSTIPESLAPGVLSATGYPWANPTNYDQDATNYVLVTKDTLREIRVAWNDRGSNMLGDWICGLLAITPDEQRQIDSAEETARNYFVQWAKANLQREGPSGQQLVRYTIPASPEIARRLTNDLYASFCSIIGAERSQLLWAYEAYWFEMKAGQFGAVSNELAIMKRPDDTQSSVWYVYRPQGHGGPVPQEALPGTFAALFPGGWQEIAQREGFELPKK